MNDFNICPTDNDDDVVEKNIPASDKSHPSPSNDVRDRLILTSSEYIFSRLVDVDKCFRASGVYMSKSKIRLSLPPF